MSSKKIGGQDRKLLNIACGAMFVLLAASYLSPTFEAVLNWTVAVAIAAGLAVLAFRWIREEVLLQHELHRPIEITPEVVAAVEARREEYARSLGAATAALPVPVEKSAVVTPWRRRAERDGQR